MPGRFRARAARSGRRWTAGAADRYRAAVETQSRRLPLFLGAAAVLDTGMRAGEAARRRRTGGTAGAGIGAGVGAGFEVDGVPADACGVSPAGELAVTFAAGEAVGVRGLALQAVDGGELVTLATTVAPCGDVVRMSARLPRETFDGARSRWAVVATDSAGRTLPVVAAGRVWPWPGDWPPRRVSSTETGVLILDGRGDRPAGVPYRIDLGIARLTIGWTPPAGAPAELHLTQRDGPGRAVIAAEPTDRAEPTDQTEPTEATQSARAVIEVQEVARRAEVAGPASEGATGDTTWTVSVVGAGGIEVPLTRSTDDPSGCAQGEIGGNGWRLRPGTDDAGRLELHVRRTP